MMLSDFVLDYLQRAVLCWLATADAQGQPSVSPKEIFAAFDAEHIVIADIASPHSVRNIALRPRVCVSFIDIFVQKGYKVYGDATIITPQDARYNALAAPLVVKTQGAFIIRHIILVKVLSCEAIIAPSYHLNPMLNEASQIAAAHTRYGVVAKHPANQ